MNPMHVGSASSLPIAVHACIHSMHRVKQGPALHPIAASRKKNIEEKGQRGGKKKKKEKEKEKRLFVIWGKTCETVRSHPVSRLDPREMQKPSRLSRPHPRCTHHDPQRPCVEQAKSSATETRPARDADRLDTSISQLLAEMVMNLPTLASRIGSDKMPCPVHSQSVTWSGSSHRPSAVEA